MVVGPLTKSELAQISNIGQLPVPTLALNTLPQLRGKTIPNLYQFALSPIDEAQQVAIKAWNDNHRRALLIAPANAWGQGIAHVLEKQWQSSGGIIVGEMNFTNQQNLTNDVAKLLNIDRAAEEQANRLKHKRNKKVNFTPKPRIDADVIFLIAEPNIARQVEPLLKFYFAGEIPVYATSSIYSGFPNPNSDFDLNGIIFCDMPWVLTPNNLQPNYLNSIQQNIKTLWPSSYRDSKLYAFGVDAYDIAVKFGQISATPQVGINGATGIIYLTPDHYLFRKLLWAKNNWRNTSFNLSDAMLC